MEYMALGDYQTAVGFLLAAAPERSARYYRDALCTLALAAAAVTGEPAAPGAPAAAESASRTLLVQAAKVVTANAASVGDTLLGVPLLCAAGAQRPLIRPACASHPVHCCNRRACMRKMSLSPSASLRPIVVQLSERMSAAKTCSVPLARPPGAGGGRAAGRRPVAVRRHADRRRLGSRACSRGAGALGRPRPDGAHNAACPPQLLDAARTLPCG